MQEFQDQTLQFLSGVVVHAAIIWVLLIAGAIGSFVLYLCEKPVRGTLLAVVPLSLLIWFIVAMCQSQAVESKEYYEIKLVTWPDGTSAQMWTADGTHHNVTTQFGKTVDPDKWQIEKVTWRKQYANISFAGVSPRLDQPTFFLSKK